MNSPDLSPQYREEIDYLRRTGETTKELIEQGLAEAQKLPGFILRTEGSETGFKTVRGSYQFPSEGRPLGRIAYKAEYLTPELGSKILSITRIRYNPDGTATVTDAECHISEGYYQNRNPYFEIDFPVGSFRFTELPGDTFSDNDEAKQRIISQIQALQT